MKIAVFFTIIISLNANALVRMEKHDEFDKFGRQYVSIFITDHIDKEDVSEFKRVLDKVKKDNLHVKYDSVILKENYGGRVVSAMEIGSLIRKNNLSTWVPKDEVCMSACVHILVAGICRMAEGDIVIHRRLNPKKEEKEMTKKEVIALRKWESDYLNDMDIDPILEWKIHGSQHWNARYISETEKLDLGLYGVIEHVEENRLNFLANNKDIDKDDLMSQLSDKYYSMNRKPSFIKRIMYILFPEKYSDIFRSKYPSCTEQLFLDK
jgi:hypothetical protein